MHTYVQGLLYHLCGLDVKAPEKIQLKVCKKILVWWGRYYPSIRADNWGGNRTLQKIFEKACTKAGFNVNWISYLLL